LPAFLAGKIKGEYGKDGWKERVSRQGQYVGQMLGLLAFDRSFFFQFDFGLSKSAKRIGPLSNG